ncbi:MAG: hypothetical protein J1E41_01195 [Ruminococcus sp.]|nr:hypothetical protein [Ruminococcus sp.]
MRRKIIGLLLILAIMASVPIIHSGNKIKKDTKSLLSKKNLTMDEAALGVLANNFRRDYDNETLKGLVLILNTNYKVNKINTKEIIGKEEFIKKFKNGEEYYSKIENTVKNMSGKCITYKDKEVYIPYFTVSKGYTEKNKKYPYLKDAACPWDCMNKDYIKSEESVGVSINSLDKICKSGANYKEALAHFIDSD